jgi:hypothetical protein
MTTGLELRKLKSEITSFDCLNEEDLRFYTNKIAAHIRKISESNELIDDLLKNYVDCVILKHLAIVEEFINGVSEYNGKEAFITKALKYHFNCIIDSYTYATVAHQHQ